MRRKYKCTFREKKMSSYCIFTSYRLSVPVVPSRFPPVPLHSLPLSPPGLHIFQPLNLSIPTNTPRPHYLRTHSLLFPFSAFFSSQTLINSLNTSHPSLPFSPIPIPPSLPPSSLVPSPTFVTLPPHPQGTDSSWSNYVLNAHPTSVGLRLVTQPTANYEAASVGS